MNSKVQMKYIIIIAMLVLVLILSACQSEEAAGEDVIEIKYEIVDRVPDGYTVSDTSINLTMTGMKTTGHSDWNDVLVFKEYEQVTNIHVDFTAIPEEQYRDKLNIILEGNQLPDAFLKGMLEAEDVIQYGANGVLMPLEDLIEEHAPNFKKLMEEYDEVKAACVSFDGHIYAIPAVVTLNSALTDKHWINVEWLENSGMDTPVTTYELVDILRIFRDSDMNGNGITDDEIPMTGENIQKVINNFTGAFGLELQMGYYVSIKDDEVNIWLKSERYKELLQYLALLYDENLLDKNIFNSNHQIFVSKINPDTVGVFHNQTDDIFEEYADDFIGISPWKGPYGDQIKNQDSIARDLGAFAITSKNEYPELTMEWVDYFYSGTGSLFFRMGVLGETYYANERGKYYYSDEIYNDPDGFSEALGKLSIWTGKGAPHWINNVNSAGINSQNTINAQSALEPYLVEEVYSRPMLDLVSEKRLKEIQSNIDLYVAVTREKFIRGELDFDAWDIYCETLDELGINELEELYQMAYNSYYK